MCSCAVSMQQGRVFRSHDDKCVAECVAVCVAVRVAVRLACMCVAVYFAYSFC